MRRDDAKAILTDEEIPSDVALELLDMNRPAGVSVEEIVEQVVQYACGGELDIIAKMHFGFCRAGDYNGPYGYIPPETDNCLRDRMLVTLQVGSLKNAPHSHTWKKYRGFTDTYDYCTGCDEKKR